MRSAGAAMSASTVFGSPLGGHHQQMPVEDDLAALHMQGLYNRALDERVVTMEADGRVVAVVFLCPDGSGLYPAWTGYDKDMQAVAVLVDLRLLDST
jgi:hypothetical protein